MKRPMNPPEAVSALWRDGWYRYARALTSPNFGPRPASACIDLIVIHSISLPPGEFGNGQVQRHEHIAHGRKQDPGPGFEWSRLQDSLGLPAKCFPAGL